MTDERVAAFIDGSNFYFSLKRAFHRADIDFHRLSLHLVGSRTLVRTYYYNAPLKKEADPQKYGDQQRFFERLRTTPYLELKLGRLQRRTGGLVEKGVDVRMAVEMIDLAFRQVYDTAILLSNDADFVDAVNLVKNLGKHVELAYVVGQRCYHLQGACDRFHVLDSAALANLWVSAS